MWYYLLMPIAKSNFFYPHALYLLNLIILLGAFYLLYRYAPFSTSTKYLITFSAPFLQMYSAFARSYTLTILFLFAILSLYNHRHHKSILYLSLIILLANTNLIGFFIAFSLGLVYFYEAFLKRKETIIPLLQTINFGLLELLLFLCQFYGYDTNTPEHSPIFSSLPESLNKAFYPLNIPIFITLICIALAFLYKNKCFKSIFFLIFSYIELLTLFIVVHHGGTHHHNFFYIILIAAYWLAYNENNKILNIKAQLPLIFLALALIFNPYCTDKILTHKYLQNLRSSAQSINKQFKQEPTHIFILDAFWADVLLPYLNPNITLLNQTATDVTTLKGLQQFLYFHYVPINGNDLSKEAKNFPNTWVYRTCAEEQYYHANMIFTLKHHLTKNFCLYDIKNVD